MACENRSKAIVKIDDEIIHVSNNPPITIEISSLYGCSLVYVEYEFEYQRRLGDGYEDTWIKLSNGIELYSPIDEAIRIVTIPEIDGYSIQIYCRGRKDNGQCQDNYEWHQVTSYGSERARNAKITYSEVIAHAEGNQTYLFKIINKDNQEEYVKEFTSIPEYEIICGCSLTKELECKANNQLGFCCISCIEISSTLKALKKKLYHE